jgi:hypothetical protein
MTESDFQRECSDFVNREVYCCVSSMAEYILTKSLEDDNVPFNRDDIENEFETREEVADKIGVSIKKLTDEEFEVLKEYLSGD